MEIQPFVFLLVKATVLLAAGLAAATALRRAPAGTRHLVWLATVAGVLALPLLVGITPMRLEILPGIPARALRAAAATPAAPARSQTSTAAVPFRPESFVPLRVVPSPATNDRVWRSLTVGQTLLVVWVAVALALLARLGAGVLAVRRIVAGARALRGPAWESVLCDTADRLGLAELPRLLCSDRVEMPFASGLWRGTIVLPEGAEEWSDERRRLVLFHELAHLRRRDLVGHMLGRLACAAYWFHPLVWTAARRLRAESERACDDLVLAGGTRPSEYAGHLLEILTSAREAGAPQAAVAMARKTEFEGRMLAILDPTAPRRVLGRFRSAALMSALAILFLCVAALAPSSPAAPSIPTASAASPASDPTETRAAHASPVQEPRPPIPPAEAATKADLKKEQAEARAERRAERESQGEQAEQTDSRLTPDQTALLSRVLRTDTDATVRRSAAWALASGADGPGVLALTAALKGDADEGVREMSAWALAEVSGDSASTALAAALQGDKSDEVRSIAAWALGQRPLADKGALLAAAADRASKVRETAIWGLGNQDIEKAPGPVVAALRDAEAPVRLVAAWALSQIADPATAPTLRAAFKEEKDEEVRQALFHALMLVGDRSPELIEQTLQSKDPDLRARAIQMLSRRGGVWPWPWPRPEPRPFP